MRVVSCLDLAGGGAGAFGGEGTGAGDFGGAGVGFTCALSMQKPQIKMSPDKIRLIVNNFLMY
jgi:hypothetical protein